MIQEIGEGKYNLTYRKSFPDSSSILLCFYRGEVAMKKTKLPEEEGFPRYGELSDSLIGAIGEEFTFLFSLDGEDYFLFDLRSITLPEQYGYIPVSNYRRLQSREIKFALVTGWHLHTWYRRNKYCGECGNPLFHGKEERMLYCEECGNTVFPHIAPAIIVGIVDGSRILLTRYAGREFKKYALVAGFVEIGECGEDAVRREVMEEVGLKIKNIRYYKSQPWGYTQSLLMGFFADLDGSDAITLDTSELSEAVWVEREDLEIKYERVSLTENMMIQFKEGRY